jgi:hypothetical protein
MIGIPYRGKHRQAAERAAADIEGHPETAEYGEPRRLSTSSMSVRLKMKEAAN